MKTENYLSNFRKAKRELKILVKKMSFSKMIIDSIIDILPKGWKVELQEYWYDISIITEIDNDPFVTADVFDKVVSKISRIFREEPKMYISEEKLEADFCIYRKTRFADRRTDYDFYVRIEIKTSNTEKCEIVYKRKMTKVAELTGYCKSLSEKKYLNFKKEYYNN